MQYMHVHIVFQSEGKGLGLFGAERAVQES